MNVGCPVSLIKQKGPITTLRGTAPVNETGVIEREAYTETCRTRVLE